MVESVIKNLGDIRSSLDSIFPSWYSQIVRLAEDIGVSESVPRKTSLQRYRSNTPSSSPQEHYKRVVAIPLVHSLISQLKDRFTGDSNNHTRALLSLIPSVFLELQEHHIRREFFHVLPTPRSLYGELERWMRLWRNEKPDDVPLNFIESLRACDMESFPNIHQLLVIGCTLPITSAEAERTFSLLQRIKVYTRSTLTEEHFSDLGVIAMHHDVTDDVVKAFLEQHPRRIFQRSVLED